MNILGWSRERLRARLALFVLVLGVVMGWHAIAATHARALRTDCWNDPAGCFSDGGSTGSGSTGSGSTGSGSTGSGSTGTGSTGTGSTGGAGGTVDCDGAFDCTTDPGTGTTNSDPSGGVSTDSGGGVSCDGASDCTVTDENGQPSADAVSDPDGTQSSTPPLARIDTASRYVTMEAGNCSGILDAAGELANAGDSRELVHFLARMYDACASARGIDPSTYLIPNSPRSGDPTQGMLPDLQAGSCSDILDVAGALFDAEGNNRPFVHWLGRMYDACKANARPSPTAPPAAKKQVTQARTQVHAANLQAQVAVQVALRAQPGSTTRASAVTREQWAMTHSARIQLGVALR